MAAARRTSVIGIALAAALHAPAIPAAELDLGVTLGATAPLTEVMRRAQAGFMFAGEFVYGPTSFFEVGLRYELGVFPQDERDAAGNVKEAVIDHGVGPLVRFTLVGGSDAGWLADVDRIGSSLWVDLGVGYHMVGREDCVGLDAGVGYEIRPKPSFYLAPVIRFTTVFDTSQGTAGYVVVGLAGGYDFGRLLDGD